MTRTIMPWLAPFLVLLALSLSFWNARNGSIPIGSPSIYSVGPNQ